jgi:hypothetical protein
MMRFILADAERRTFYAQRWCYFDSSAHRQQRVYSGHRGVGRDNRTVEEETNAIPDTIPFQIGSDPQVLPPIPGKGS